MATIPANNNTGLYNTSGVPATTGNDLTVTGNVNANNINAVNTVNAGTTITAGTNITAGGNVTADYFIGDGSLLTNINAGNIVGSYGNANVAAYLASGSNSSNIVTTGNVSGTYILGNGSQLTGITTNYSNSNVTALLAAFGSNTISTTGNITGGNIAGGNGNITGDLTVGGTIYGTFSGNISGNIVVPGANTQVLFNNSGNVGANPGFTYNKDSNVLALIGTANVSALNSAGNVTGSNFVGNGQYLTNLPGANVTGTVPLATAATTAGTVTTAAQPNITSVGTLTSLSTSGNVNVGGSLNTDDITSTGDVTVIGNQVITGNLTVQGTTTTINSNTITTNDKTITVANNQSTGANVNGAGLEAGNPAVATFLYDDATVTWKSSIGLAAVGNITGSYIFGNGSQLTGLPATYNDSNVNTHLAAFGSNTIVTTGNITGGNFIGSGAALTSLTGANVVGAVANATYATSAGSATTATTAGTVTTNAQPAITSVGTLTSLGVTGNITAGGIKTDGYYYANGTPLSFGGSYSDSNVTTLLAALGSNVISSTANITTSANVSGAYVIGNGSALSSITGANVTGTVANATYATSAGTATTAGTVTTNAQPNITSVGTLTSLSVSGNTTTANLNLSGQIYDSSGVLQLNGSGNIVLVPVGSTVMYGNADVVGNVAAGNIAVTGGITAGANISGNYILGNGSLLTGIASSYGNANVSNFLANFGSNTIVTTGNISGGNLAATGGVTAGYINTTGATGNITGANYITANYFVGNGSLLTGVTATANLSGAMSGDITGGNVYSINFIKDLSLSGNISNPAGDSVVIEAITTGGLFNSTANITTTANVSGAYFIGNGSQLTGVTATANLAGNLSGNINTGSYYITSPGAEVLMGNVWVTGTLAANTISAPAGDYVTIEGVASSFGLNSSGNINALNQKSVNFYETGSTNYLGLKAPTSVAADVVWTLPGTDGTSGQALSTYGNGVMYWATGGGGSPGGSNTQIQFNDGGAFAGNAAITFNKTNGNITLGTTVVNAQQIQTVANANVGLTTSLTPNPGRIVVGAGYNGNTSPAYDQANAGRSARFLVSDSYGITDSNSVVRGASVQNFYTLNGNITGTNARIGAMSSALQIGGGSAANVSSSTSVFTATAMVSSLNIGGGTSGNLTALGNTTIQAATAFTAIPTINTGSTGGNIFGSYLQLVNNGTCNTFVGYSLAFTSTGTFGNTYGVYMPGGTSTYGVSSSNNARNANYFFLKNDDDHSYSDVGQLTQYQETQYALASSSAAVTVNKSNGQVQLFTVSEDATVSFSNFVVSSTVGSTTRYMTDTVTVIVKQDSTGRTITMPSGSAYKYAGGINTVPTTADSVSMISITAYYDTTAAATAYLVTISPEFS